MAFEDRIRLPTLNLIHRRSRLLNMLTEFIEAGNRLITIYAPGGYGKSILLADFAQTTDLPVCWCSLEPVDRDPTSFLTLLAYSITDRFHEIEPDGLLRLVQQGDTQVSIRRIADLLAEVGPHIIIIDDYHKAISAGMSVALNRLLEQLPGTSTVILAARGDLTLETGQVIDLLIAERATGLSEEELRFTPVELQRVMRKRFGRQLDQDSAEEIAWTTDGNIAQILLTGHLMHAEGMISRLRQQLGDDRAVIYSYLAEEVFDKQPPELQHFMLHTAILPDMSAELCNELLEVSEAQALLEQLVRKDLFITQVGAGFRYHDLFAEFLRSKLAEDDGHHRHISIKAGNILAGHARFEEAVVLYLSVQAWDETVALLETQGGGFYDTGRALTLYNWLAQIPEPELTERPGLLLLKGQILNNDLSELEPAMKLFQQAEQQFSQQDDMIGVAQARLWQSVSLRMMGRATEGLQLAEQGVAQLESLNADDRMMAWAIRNRGIAYGIAGNLQETLLDLRRALALFEELGDTYGVGMCHCDIGVVLERQGNISGADRHYRRAVQIWETLGNANDLARALNSLGVLLYTIGSYDEALKRFNESLDLALQTDATGEAAFVLAGIGDVYLDCQDYEPATKAYTQSTDLARTAGIRPLEIYNMVKLGECFFQQQDLIRAFNLASQAGEIAAETGLSFEKGLACTLQAKVYVRWANYADSFELFGEALASFAENDAVERVKVRLWWGYGLLLDFRPLAAFAQLQEAMRLALTVSEVWPRLGSTVAETNQVLQHFRYREDFPDSIRDSIRQLLEQNQLRVKDSSPVLQVIAFGSPAVIIENEYKYIFRQRGRIRKVPEFLLYLILETRDAGYRWNEISAELWPDLDPDKAKAQFHSTLRRLRNLLGPQDYITVQDDYYQINNQYLAWCDALAFEVLFEQATTASPEEALTLQLELISLYRGEFLTGVDLGDWGIAYRAKCETRFLRTIKLAGEQLLQNDSPHTVLDIVNKGLAQDYFREDLHCLAFHVYAQLNQFDDLTAHYQELYATFEQEFGAPPLPETQRLYQQLIAKQ